jgi:hypothetical protein
MNSLPMGYWLDDFRNYKKTIGEMCVSVCVGMEKNNG